jgi:hypothetical protein
MKITIIREDGAVYKNNVAYSGLDLSTVPADVHALQFNDASNAGWVEFVQDDFGNKSANETITSLPAWAITAMIKWDEAKAIATARAEAAANQPVTTGTQTA